MRHRPRHRCAARGREVFLNDKLTKCAVCNKLNGQGGDVVPDLSAIGGKFDRPHLIESLRDQSRQIERLAANPQKIYAILYFVLWVAST